SRAKRFGTITNDVKLTPGQTVVQQPAIALPRANSLVVGTVVDAAGKPVFDVDVQISGRTTQWQHMKTDAKGAFEFVDVVEGETLYIRLVKNGEYLDGGNVKAGTIGAEIMFKPAKK